MPDRLDIAMRRRRLSMTSLIDVIFLLLLFFMLSSTFARQGELPLDLAMAGADTPPATPPLFLQLLPDALRLNSVATTTDDLHAALDDADGGLVLIAMADGVDAQRLADILHLIQRRNGWRIGVIGARGS
ncbi:ExbD/TolR family protein [Roseinatronobacter alkalisoli]|uniref:Biopolymer transporter ExbD n=1 Tax=Roseinatronobacter alkalisoli TaxID=3028235 RepID=A0ABT5T3Z4_9RHOB|nr:biopolymer transporter ExbD [Roseinatronobacter sp. HJB301]MDD7969840.1 biopolymer transporter ExbD [Roseinatronobacter sp. HJB301]